MSRSLAPLALLLLVCIACSSGAPERSTSLAPSTTPFVSPAASADLAAGPEDLAALSLRMRPTQPELAASYRVALVPDHCTDRDLAAPTTPDAAMTVLDRSYGLAVEDVPPDLVAASTAGLDGASGTKLVRNVVIDDLAAMAEAWRAAGLSMIIESGYRSHAAQAATFDSWSAQLGPAAALTRTARPGHSEHQLGTAIDLTSPGWAGRFGDWALQSTEGAWMASHAVEYGFVMSYPAGGEAQTCFGYEPWHYRWIGREAAEAHRSSGLSLRQFLERYLGAA